MISRLLLAILAATVTVSAQSRARPKLTTADIDQITQLVVLEDTRQFDEVTLAHAMGSTHPEVRRRAVLAVGRIADARGRALLETARADTNADVVATVVFAAGQLKDPASVPWLAERLSSRGTPPVVAKEAAIALGKIRAPEARTALARYLAGAPATAATVPIVGEALLSIGRFTTREDLAPIVRWTMSPYVDVRWRAAWALFRPRDPAAVPHLLRLSRDASADVRFWAVRGLAPAPAATRGTPPPSPNDAPSVDAARLSARLRDAVGDTDRRVRTEALRALAMYDDDASFAVVLAALDSTDTWFSVSAAEAMGRFTTRADVVVPRLVAAAAPTKPTALRMTAMTPLSTLAPESALELASALARDSSVVARTSARQALQRLGPPGRDRLDALPADPAAPVNAPSGTTTTPATAAARTAADYRRIVERWIVPDYLGAPKPRAIWETARGPIEIELYPGDAPLAVEYFVRVVESGDIVGTEFGRVVPNFVAQQRAIRNALTLRDEVNRRGLTRGNLSWASAGLDTGRPGYTLGSTPQPHNEGDFTALGRVIRGLDVVDHLELGDRVTAARMLPPQVRSGARR